MRSRYTLLGAITVAFGAMVMTYNLGSEYLALEGITTFTESPTAQSMMRRAGGSEEFNEKFASRLAWVPILQDQVTSIGIMSIPFGLPGYKVNVNADYARYESNARWIYLVGWAALGSCVVGLVWVRHRGLWLTILLSGFLWALPMRRSSFLHDFEALFYIGIPLMFFSLALMFIRKICADEDRITLVILAIAAVLLFNLSVLEMRLVSSNPESIEFQREILSDFENIRSIANGKYVHVQNYVQDTDGSVKRMNYGGAPFGVQYYLSDAIISTNPILEWRHHPQPPDYLLTHRRVSSPALLTTDNHWLFLYDFDLYYDEGYR